MVAKLDDKARTTEALLAKKRSDCADLAAQLDLSASRGTRRAFRDQLDDLEHDVRTLSGEYT